MVLKQREGMVIIPKRLVVAVVFFMIVLLLDGHLGNSFRYRREILLYISECSEDTACIVGVPKRGVLLAHCAVSSFQHCIIVQP